MQDNLGESLERFLSDPRFAVLSGTKDENVALLRDLWENHADAFFVRADRDYPEHGIPKGTMVLQENKLERWMAKEADRLTRFQNRAKKATEAATRNSAAVAPSKPFTPAAPARPAAPSAPTRQPTTAPEPENEFEAWKEKTMSNDSWADVLE